MRIFEASDIHTEVFSDGGWPEFFKHLPYETFDLLILAGDILNLRDMKRLSLVFDRILNKTRVIYVLGNHEYWGTHVEPQVTWETVLYPAIEKYKDRLFVLRTGFPAVIDGQRFVGDTMWFPDLPDAQKMMPHWPESKHIPGYRKWVFEQNRKWNRFARSEIQAGDIVVTHHTPSYQSTPPSYRGHGFNCFYSDMGMESVIMKKKPKIWFHGHTHSFFDYQICDTRILCNPRGIPTQPPSGFKPDLIIEI